LYQISLTGNDYAAKEMILEHNGHQIDMMMIAPEGIYYKWGGARLDTDQLDITNHSDRCLEASHCSSAVSRSCSIDSCPNGGHPYECHHNSTVTSE